MLSHVLAYQLLLCPQLYTLAAFLEGTLQPHIKAEQMLTAPIRKSLYPQPATPYSTTVAWLCMRQTSSFCHSTVLVRRCRLMELGATTRHAGRKFQKDWQSFGANVAQRNWCMKPVPQLPRPGSDSQRFLLEERMASLSSPP